MANAPLPKIAPVEAMLAVVGIDAIISRAIEKVTKAKLSQMNHIPKEIDDLARKLVHGELERKIGLSDFNWRKAIKELAAGWNVDQVVEMTAQFPQEYQTTAQALIIKSQQVIQQLSEGLPLSRYQTISGSIDLIPTDTHIFKFSSILEIVRNPLIVFTLINTGALLKSQANACRVVYPTISQAIDAAILQQTISAKADKKSFELPPKVEYGIKAWYGKGPLSTDDLQKAQAVVARSNAKRTAALNPPSPTTPPNQSLLSKSQKVEEATA